MDILSQTYFGDILHIVSQALLLPTVIALLLLICYALWCVGSILVETFTEHRHFKVVMPTFMETLTKAKPSEVPGVIAKKSNLLANQKRALLTLWDFRCLPEDALMALAKRLMDELENRHTKKISRTSSVSKVAPMFGLMGTLIPLGPGIYSLSLNDTATLSSSLLIAFDTTVAGLLVAMVTYVVTKIRHRWYDNYMGALEAACVCMLEKIGKLRDGGKLDATEPTHELDRYFGKGRAAAQTVGQQSAERAGAIAAGKAGQANG